MERPERTTVEVVNDHLRCRATGAIEDDLTRNYDDEVLVICGGTARRGHGAARELERELHASAGQPAFEYVHRIAEGNIAYLVWRSRWAGVHVHDGTETYICRDGRIVSHTLYYSLTAKRSADAPAGSGWRADRDADARRW